MTAAPSDDTNARDDAYTFTCPECNASFDVDAYVKHALVDTSCLFCDHDVTDGEFHE